MLYLIHGTAATYHVGWSGEEGRRLGAHNLLLWEAMSRLAAHGVRRLDLGGVNTQSSAGVARFKLGAGGEVVTLAGTWL
jgi:lipid II:glycine glycyltransferase (peptidoglycan interpeptide bridge formation enzyme)